MTDHQLPATRGSGGLPSTEAATASMAASMAEAILDNEADADPISIKTRAQAAMLLCEDRKWLTAKQEFAYVAICCEWRWERDNPRQPRGGDRKSNAAPAFETSPVAASTRRDIHDAYEGVTADDMREAKAWTDEAGRPVTRRDVRPLEVGLRRPERSLLISKYCFFVERLLSQHTYADILGDALNDADAARCEAAHLLHREWLRK